MLSCAKSDKVDLLFDSLSSDGVLFSYSRIRNDIASVYIINRNSRIIKIISDPSNHVYQGEFINGFFFM